MFYSVSAGGREGAVSNTQLEVPSHSFEVEGQMHTLLGRAGLTLAGLLVPLAAQAQGYPDHHYMWDEGWGWGHMIFGSVMMIAFWGGIIVLIVLAVRWLGGSGHGSGHGPGYGPTPGGKSAVDILRERFARGEIDKAEFEERRRILGD
jgi:putative membrane protein